MTASNDHSYHTPVMLAEVLEGLNVKPSGTYVDVTFGGGGHSRAILERLGPEGHLVAFDQDEDAAAVAACLQAQNPEQQTPNSELRTPNSEPRFTFIRENFRHLKAFLRLHGVRRVDGLLADLGVSSHQFDTAERGFSTRFDGELDMRMDRRNPLTAEQIVNTYDEAELVRLLRYYGELPNARQMARAIVDFRTHHADDGGIHTTTDLRTAVSRHLPRGMENKYLAMLFQALRIEVGGELDALRELLCQATELLVPGGRLAIISYHSLEDRLVKNYMRAGNFDGEVAKDFYGNPLVPLRPLVKTTASAAEVENNPRARSARLRVAERLGVVTDEK